MVSGDTTNLNDDYNNPTSAGTCFPVITNGTANGPDGVYAFTPSQSGSYTMTATPTGFDIVLYILEGSCPAGNVGSCTASADAKGANAAEVVTAQLTAGTTYYVVVDGYQAADKGPFTLLINPAGVGESCASPLALSNLTGPGTQQTVNDSTANATDDYTPSCGTDPFTGSSSPDKVYTFTTTAYTTLTASVSTTDSTYTPVLVLANAGCADVACTVASAGGGTATLDFPQLPPGTYLLVVDGDASGGLFGGNPTSGPFTLTASLSLASPPPSNDVCSGAQAVSLNTNVSVDTTNARNDTSSDVNGPCGGAGHGGDLVYKVTVPASTYTYLSASVSGLPAPVVYIRSTCDSSYPDGGVPAGYVEYDCGDPATDGGPVAAVGDFFTYVPAGTYYIWVDDYSGTYGSGTLSVSAQ